MQDGAGAGSGSSRRPPAASGATMTCVLKYLAPEAMAAAIIGKGGAVIAQMRASCSAKMALTEKDELFPQTDCRVLTVQAHTEESLNDVSRQIVAKLGELAKTGTSPAEAIGTDGDLKIRLLVPRAAVGGVIGKGGASIKQIRESSGAKVSISEAQGQGPGAEQQVSISGTTEALEYVLLEVNRQIQLLNSEPWFATWASTTGVVKAGSASAAGYGGGRNMPAAPGTMPNWVATDGRSQHRMSPSPGVDAMMRVAQGLPPYVMEDARGFAMSCMVPTSLVGGLIGRGGSGTKEVQNLTGTKISLREIPEDTENRALNIAGPLLHVCAAYMLMMKRYLDAEAQAREHASG